MERATATPTRRRKLIAGRVKPRALVVEAVAAWQLPETADVK